MRICGYILFWGPYNVLLHFWNLDIHSIEKLDDALLAPLGILKKIKFVPPLLKITFSIIS